MKSDRHPEFDRYWVEHKGLVWFMAQRIGRSLKQSRRELLGSLVLLFNHCLYSYDPDRGKLSTYFYRSCMRHILTTWMINESQSWSQFVRDTRYGDCDWVEAAGRSLTCQINESHHLYYVPKEDESDVQAVLDCFDTAQDCWEFLTRYMEERDRCILSCYFRDSMSMRDIGDKLCITRERVRQLMERAKLHMRGRLKMVQALADLFDKPLTEE